MVVLSEIVCCTHCSSSDVIRFGTTDGGNQRYRCHACGKTFCRNPGTRAHPQEFKEQVLNAYQERASMRGVCRVFGISRNTLIKWLGEKSTVTSPS